MYLCTRSTQRAQFTSQHAEGIAHAVKRGTVSFDSKLTSKPKPKKKLLSCKMRGGAGVQDKLLLVLLKVTWFVIPSPSLLFNM